jgi:ParB family chromosome partitioning protein
MPAKDGQTFTLPAKTNLNADLFSTQATRDDAQREKVQSIPLDQIDPFPEHPFHVREDEAMTTMVESVKAVGVLTPAVARQKEDGRYELVSGHRRKHACELAGLDAMPVIVREMTHDEAVIFMVESNFQREVILPSE